MLQTPCNGAAAAAIEDGGLEDSGRTECLGRGGSPAGGEKAAAAASTAAERAPFELDNADVSKLRARSLGARIAYFVTVRNECLGRAWPKCRDGC